MRVLVLSDSHGQALAMKRAIEAQPSAEAVIFLGDGYRDFEYCKSIFPEKTYFQVKGNNDFHCDYPLRQTIELADKRIYITHGHYEYVKSSSAVILTKANENGCQIAIHGHTHLQKNDYYDGTHIFCPGALYNNEYGVIDIIDNGIICIGMRLK